MTDKPTTERPAPTWSVPKYGDEERLHTPAGTLTVASESRSRDDPRPHAYSATVFDQWLKKTFTSKDEMKDYAIRTAKSWLTKGLADLDAYTAAKTSKSE
jgi:hypothetical protein